MSRSKTNQAERMVADHLSRITEHNSDSDKINDGLPGQLMQISQSDKQTPWYADLVNYLACGIDPPDMTYQQKKKFKNDAKHFYWDEHTCTSIAWMESSRNVLLTLRFLK